MSGKVATIAAVAAPWPPPTSVRVFRPLKYPPASLITTSMVNRLSAMLALFMASLNDASLWVRPKWTYHEPPRKQSWY